MTEIGPNPREVPHWGIPDQWTKFALVTDESPLANPNQFPILYQDIRLKDKRRVEFSDPPTLKPKSRKISLKEYLDHEPTPTAPMMAIDDPPMDDSTQELSLSVPSFEWEHMVYQLNQDPHADSIAGSG